MTDEQMDARLRRAGETWRAANGPSAGPADFDELLVTPGTPHPRRTALLVVAAAVAAALVAGAGFLLAGGNSHKRSTDSAATPLEGTVWRLVDDGHRRAANSLATLYLSKDGRLVADDECTVLDLQVDVRGGSLMPTRTNVRQRDCVDATGGPVFDRSSAVFIGRIGYRVDGPRLTLSIIGTELHLVAAPELPRPSADVPTRVGATWRLVKVLDVRGTDHPVAGNPTFRIDNDRLVASDGCNTLSGSVAPDGGPLDNGGLAITEMACADPTATATAAVVDAVLNGRPPEYAVNGTTLTLKKDHVGELTYRWVPEDDRSVDSKSLVGRTWHLASIAGVPAAGEATLRVGADNRISWNDGCTQFGADAEVAPGTLSVLAAPSGTNDGCPKAIADQAATFDSFLKQDPALWAIRNGRLQIYGGGAQASSLVFTPDVAVPAGAAITGKAWRLTGVTVTTGNSASGQGSSDMGVTLTLDGRRYELATPCGSSEGPATIGSASVDFGRPSSVGGPACKNEIGSQVEKALTGTVQYRLHAGQLTLTKGDVELTFEP
jgi:heat shock protein HslJ